MKKVLTHRPLISFVSTAVATALVTAVAMVPLGCIGQVTGVVPTDGAGGGAMTGPQPGPDAATPVGTGGRTGQGGAPATAASGLPCDVQAMLVARCTTCHGSSPSGGAPMSMVTYADLMAPARSNPGMTVAQLSLARMQNVAAPMPPAPAARASVSEVALMQSWSTTGFPTGACGSAGPDAGPTDASAGGTGGRGGTGGAAGKDGGSATGLPCDVQTVLSNRCVSCHGGTPAQGAPMSMISYADLTAPSRSNPSMTVAQLSVARMQNSTSPMPPAPATRATAAETATIQSWIGAGYPSGTCGAADGGAGSDGGVVADPFKAAPTCTSKQTWSGGNQGSSSMNPGLACINCHSSGEGPGFSIAGTVYPTAHEPDRCNGFGSGAAQVVIIGADGRSTTLTPNGAGNFSSSTSVARPYQAKVVYQGRERIMTTAQTSGDCNACHTQSGAMNAPGRILLP